MATKKDLVEAHSFSRRRLVTAFLSGAPGGREVEPTRPGRTVVGGVALAVLLIAAAAIASVLASRPQEDWNKEGLVVSRDEAAPYVILKEEEHPTLIPVINLTSAQLILGADLVPTYVDQEIIEDQTPGEPIGIFGAPQTLPRPSRFIQSGWSACTAGAQVMTRLASEPEVSVPEQGARLVQSEGSYYLIARSGETVDSTARAYPLAKKVADSILTNLGLDDTKAQVDQAPVPGDWLRLFPPGGELGWDSFGIERAGQPVPDPDPALPADALIAEYWARSDGTGIVLTQDGPVLLNPFALQVYAGSVVPRSGGANPVRRTDEAPQTDLGVRAYDEALWPETTLTEVDGEQCALLVTQEEGVPVVELAADPESTASAAELVRPDVSVERGRGAFVRSGDFGDVTSESAWVIDPRGEAFPLTGLVTIENLKYDDVEEPLVPDPWIKLFECGTELSTSLALSPPDPERRAEVCPGRVE